MTALPVSIGGRYLRLVDPQWTDPLDASFAARDGQRWNPAGVPCLYLNNDRETARANVARLFVGMPYGPEDLDADEAPLLLEVDVPTGIAVDAYTDAGLRRIGLPVSYPRHRNGRIVSHHICQAIGATAFDDGLDGVDARSAAPGGDRELAWFPRERRPTIVTEQRFDAWF